MDRRMDGGWLNEESDGERVRSIGRYTQMQTDRQPDRQFTDPVQPIADTRTFLSHQRAQKSEILGTALSKNHGS
jgi:hypothetical protein